MASPDSFRTNGLVNPQQRHSVAYLLLYVSVLLTATVAAVAEDWTEQRPELLIREQEGDV